MTTKNADIGLVGLAVMGQNLALNIADHGYTIAVYNRDPKKMVNFIEECQKNEPSHANVVGHADLASFVLSIKRPRKIILLVKAGSATDVTINALLPFLEQGGDLVEARVAFGPYRRTWLGLAQHPIAHGHAGALETEIQSEKGLLVIIPSSTYHEAPKVKLKSS